MPETRLSGVTPLSLMARYEHNSSVSASPWDEANTLDCGIFDLAASLLLTVYQ